uniref:MKS transition zone complex subunit 1 n=1 Tax=Oryzias sinensis TaxID=183150 RepID=A0A8C8E1S8_9TELE
MADGWNTDTGEAVYRSQDIVKNLKIKVRIERVTSTAALSQHFQQQVLSQQEGGDIELKTLSSPAQKGDNDDEVVVGWQEKIFSQYEMELFQNEAVCQTPLDRQYHKEVKALIKAKSRRSRRIFTYTDHDRYTNCLPLHQLVYLLTTTKTGPTFLAERMATVKNRRQERRTMDSSIPKTRIINWEPTEEFVRTSRVVNNAMQTMHIMGDLGPPGRLGQKENECLLITIKTDGHGTIVVKPDFNKGREIVAEGENREIWRLTFENVSKSMKPEEKNKEQNMYKDLYVRHKEFLSGLVGQDFEMPPAGTLRYLMNGEIVSAQGFEYDNLYIHFFLELPNSKSLVPVVQCFYILFVFVCIPGKHTMTCHTWRPVQTGTVSAMKRFFIGGSAELEDDSYVRTPGTFKGDRLSRFGFCTVTTGSVTFNLHCIQQARAFVDAAVLKRRRQKVFEHLGGFSQQGAVCNILEAFQRARKKMQEARESFPRGVINTGSQLQQESSA